jgi:hypothetical protein
MSIEKSDAAILATFHGMEENIEYTLNDFWLKEMNRVRKEYGYSILEDKREFILSRKGEKLFLNGYERFDFKNKVNLTLALAIALTLAELCDVAVALQHNGIEKLNKDTCEGRIVEIDGRKYKLTSV